MLFAALVLPREPLQWGQFFGAANLWIQNAGAVAALALAIWVLAHFLQRGQPFGALVADAPHRLRGPLATLVSALACISFIGFGAVLSIGLGGVLGATRMVQWMPRAGQEMSGEAPTLSAGDYVLSLSGLLALIVAVTPMVLGLTRLRVGRIWALARLSLKEAVRSRVVLVFAFMTLIFLFADWFVPYRPQDQVRNYVRVIYWSITPLFLMAAGLLGSLSIPNDIKNQSIHTIVTKPVEKFEIVLGRFLGYGLLLTVGLAVVSFLSLGYVVRGVNKAAEQESFKARVPIFGRLSYLGTENRQKGENAGREWDYRGYISGPHPRQKDAPRQYAVWEFDELPAALAERDRPVPCEFTFDIFRLSKGLENTDIPCTFTFADGGLPLEEINKRLVQLQLDRANRPGDIAPDAFEQTLIERYGIFEAAGVAVTDYHTQSQDVPVALFKKLLAVPPAERPAGAPRLVVLVSVDPGPEAQMLGVARRDLYLLAADRPFWVNFLKGITGMWCTHMLVLGIAVACSTYLSGMISWLCTMFLFGAGMFTEYLHNLAANRPGEGGGPAEALLRVATARVQAAPLEQSPGTSVLRGADEAFNWALRRMLNLLPDVNRFDLHTYVANGFDIPVWNVLVIDDWIPLIGYLVPWAILAYYLMRYREIANPT